MKTRLIAMVIIVLGIFWASITEGQALRDVFKRVNSSVVVIRAVETNVIAGPPVEPAIAGGLGSGVLISTDGEIMTAAHLVDTADTVSVEFFKTQNFRVPKSLHRSPLPMWRSSSSMARCPRGQWSRNWAIQTRPRPAIRSSLSGRRTGSATR